MARLQQLFSSYQQFLIKEFVCSSIDLLNGAVSKKWKGIHQQWHFISKLFWKKYKIICKHRRRKIIRTLYFSFSFKKLKTYILYILIRKCEAKMFGTELFFVDLRELILCLVNGHLSIYGYKCILQIILQRVSIRRWWSLATAFFCPYQTSPSTFFY